MEHFTEARSDEIRKGVRDAFLKGMDGFDSYYTARDIQKAIRNGVKDALNENMDAILKAVREEARAAFKDAK